MAQKKNNLTLVKRKIRQYVKELSCDIKVDQAILFGSWAKGNHSHFSDIDIAIVSGDFSRFKRVRNIAFLLSHAGKIDSRIEPLPLTPEEIKDPDTRSFAAEILETGKVMYNAH
ncbi:nucleotidyltransferase domain-containing protein [candidate division TA06 bacterium]|uniref:Nucleotidyltransferase domain-containing protein n=1 Tax=candidate division TA06 bacterium TaxID=2250710 RepID=A0A933ML95_UNCT6|nr:nucleotidyltransferase domain-containing protein [candidate division TA06 bacterium]